MGPSVPDMQLVADALAAEGVAEGAVVVEEGILGADGQHDIEPPQHGELLGQSSRGRKCDGMQK